MIGTVELTGTMTQNPERLPQDDDALIETGDQGVRHFKSIPEAEPPEAYEQVFSDGILPPSEDRDAERDRLQDARHILGWRLGTLAVSENTMLTVVDCGNELITNAKRYAGGGRITVSFMLNGELLVEVDGHQSDPPEVPQEPSEAVDEFESLDLGDLGIDMAELQAEAAKNLTPEEAAEAEALQALIFDGAEHGRGIRLVKSRSKTMGRYRKGPEDPWSVWFTVGDSAQNLFKQVLVEKEDRQIGVSLKKSEKPTQE